jgi:hypothetical protein
LDDIVFLAAGILNNKKWIKRNSCQSIQISIFLFCAWQQLQGELSVVHANNQVERNWWCCQLYWKGETLWSSFATVETTKNKQTTCTSKQTN